MIRQIIVLTPVYVSVFWAVVFLVNAFSLNRARYWLGVFMLTVAVLYACHATFFLGYSGLYLQIDSLYLVAGLSVFPLYYLYVRLLTCDLTIRRSYIIHFIPPLLLGLALFLTSRFASSLDRQLYYSEVLVKNHWPGAGAGLVVQVMSLLFFLSRLVFGVQVVGYLIAGYLLAKKYDHRIENFYSNLEGRKLVWVKLLTISFLLTSIASSIANVLGRGLFMTEDWLLAIPSALFSSLFFIIGLQGNKQNYTISTLVSDEKEELTNGKESVNNRSDELKDRLIRLLETQKNYLDSDLRITDLSKEFNTNRTYLSNMINNEFNLSFSDLINLYRVNHAVELIDGDKSNNMSLGDIAIASGFGSLSSFNRAFKKVNHITAGQYRTSQKANEFTD